MSQFYYLMIRTGMTGGSNRSVFKMLCQNPGWKDQSAEGGANFGFGGITDLVSIGWRIVEAENDNDAQYRLSIVNSEHGNDDANFFVISLEEAMRIEKGEKVKDPAGNLNEKSLQKIDQSSTKMEFTQKLIDLIIKQNREKS